jgi:hypothetical protein
MINKLKAFFQFYIHLIKIMQSEYFDAAYYLKNNPGIGHAKLKLAKHYLLHGGFENRNPSPDFTSSFYLRYYPDVAASGMNPLLHFIEFGKNEGRATNPGSQQHMKKPIHLRKSNRSEYCRKFSNDLHDYIVPFHNLTDLQLEVTTACN